MFQRVINKFYPITFGGLDLGTFSTKFVALAGEGRRYCLQSFFYTEQSTNKSSSKINFFQWVKLFPKTYVAVAVPDLKVISKTIQFEKDLTEEEIENLILLEAERYISYPGDQIDMDFIILENSLQSSNLHVLVVATHKQNITHLIARANKFQAVVKAVDVQSFALERVARLLTSQLDKKDQQKLIGIIDMGLTAMTATIFLENSCIFSRCEAFGAEQFKEIMQLESKDLTPEIDVSKKVENFPDKELIYDSYKEQISFQINRNLQFFYANNPSQSVERIFLSGGIALIPGLTRYLSEKLALRVELANPFLRMELASSINIEDLHTNAPRLVTACGLALHRFNK